MVDDPEAGAPLAGAPVVLLLPGVEGFAAGGVEPVLDGAVVLDDGGVSAVWLSLQAASARRPSAAKQILNI